MKKNYFIIILFSLWGCNSIMKEKYEDIVNPLDPIFIDATSLNETDVPLTLSQFAESISYIPLSENPLIGDISYTKVVIAEDSIYLDCDNIYKYAPDGKFIKKLFVEGQGPGEALKYSITPAIFNIKEKYVTFSYKSIYDVSYSFDGVFLGKSNYYNAATDRKVLEKYFSDYYLYSISNVITSDSKSKNSLGAHLFHVKDLYKDSIIYSYPNPAADYNPQNSKRGRIELHNPDMNFITIDSVLWFKHRILDTIFSTQDFITILPRYIFKTDNTYFNIHEYIDFKNGVVDINRVKVSKTIEGILPLPNGNLLFTIKGGKISFGDSSGIVNGCTMKLVKNDLDEYLKEIDIASIIDNRNFHIYNNHLYILIDAFKFFEEGCKPPFKELYEDSNPIVLKIKLKKN